MTNFVDVRSEQLQTSQTTNSIINKKKKNEIILKILKKNCNWRQIQKTNFVIEWIVLG